MKVPLRYHELHKEGKLSTMPIRPSVQARDPHSHLGACLGKHLREIRLAAGHRSQDSLALAMKADRSVVGKAESGEFPPTPAVLGKWLDFCDIHDAYLRRLLEDMARIARIRENPGQEQVASWYPTEARAHTLRYWAPTIVPGITQTPGYANELFRALRLSTAQVEEFLAIRLARQQILTRDDAPDTVIVIWEHVLNHQIGTREIMHEQVGLLLEVAELPTVALHVLPASRGANPGLGGAIGLAATDDAPELLVRDALVMDQITADSVLVRKARSTFGIVRADAYSSADTRTLLTEVMGRWS